MRSEHNRGASLAAFLLAVSTMTLLFVSPVEGQGAPCTTNVDCLSDPSEPYCVIPDGAPSGECSAFCDITAYPFDEAGSCPITQDGFQYCSEDGFLGLQSTCSSCSDLEPEFGIASGPDCEQLLNAGYTQETVANCQRACFDYYACTTDAECQNGFSPVAVCTNGQCGACEVNAFPGADGSCPDTDSQGRPEALLCQRGTCSYCGSIQLSECSTVYDADGPDQVANCQRECFGFYACATNADCPDTLPICNAGQCEISVISALDGMGGGSSA